MQIAKKKRVYIKCATHRPTFRPMRWGLMRLWECHSCVPNQVLDFGLFDFDVFLPYKFYFSSKLKSFRLDVKWFCPVWEKQRLMLPLLRIEEWRSWVEKKKMTVYKVERTTDSGKKNATSMIELAKEMNKSLYEVNTDEQKQTTSTTTTTQHEKVKREKIAQAWPTCTLQKKT